jgi:hypothetical protein
VTRLPCCYYHTAKRQPGAIFCKHWRPATREVANDLQVYAASEEALEKYKTRGTFPLWKTINRA